MSDELLKEAREKASKFVHKVESGRARSKETYADMKALVASIDAYLAAPEEQPVGFCGLCGKPLNLVSKGCTNSHIVKPINVTTPQPSTVVVGGIWMEETIGTHVMRCERLIGDEQLKVSPDNALIALLCDSVRMAREYTRWAAPAAAPLAPGLLRAAAIAEKRAQESANDENGYTEDDTNAYIWTNLEAEWVAIQLDEFAAELRALAEKEGGR